MGKTWEKNLGKRQNAWTSQRITSKNAGFQKRRWGFPKLWLGTPSHHPFIGGFFPYKPTILGTPMTMETPIRPKRCWHFLEKTQRKLTVKSDSPGMARLVCWRLPGAGFLCHVHDQLHWPTMGWDDAIHDQGWWKSLVFLFALPYPMTDQFVWWIDANMTGVNIDGKWQTIYGIHTDPSWDVAMLYPQK